MGMKKWKKVAMIAAASMFVMMMPMIQTHAAPTDVIENNESGIPDRTLYQNILKVLGKQSTDTFTEQEARKHTLNWKIWKQERQPNAWRQSKNGYFKLKKLNLKKWGGAKVQVNLYKYSKEQKRKVQVVCNTVLKVKKK